MEDTKEFHEFEDQIDETVMKIAGFLEDNGIDHGIGVSAMIMIILAVARSGYGDLPALAGALEMTADAIRKIDDGDFEDSEETEH